MTTIVDVAKLAGVSISTVSRFLNDSGHPVNIETKKRVLEATKALNYSPNALARALITNKTSILGLIARDVLDPYFAAIVRGAEDLARAVDFLLIVCNSDRIPETEIQYVSTLNDYRVDGILFAGGGLKAPSYVKEMQRLLQFMRGRGCAIVSIGWQEFPCVRICNNEIEATKAAAQHLISLGHRRICYISGPGGITTTELRLEGYKQALKESGIPFDPTLIVQGDYSIQSGLEATNQILRIKPLPTAVLASNDQMAIGCMRNLKKAGLTIPQDVSIVGVDDIAMAEWVDPPLTTISLHLEELGARGVEYAIKLRNGEINYDSSFTVRHELIVRESVSPI